jgi:YVTN family beta-propeller protein
MTMNTRTVGGAFAAVVGIVLCTVAISAQQKVRIIQTNSAGDNVHLIDPATNKVVGVISGIEVSHGAGASPDGRWIYVSNEAESTLDVVDAKTLKVTKNIKLSGRPNNMAVGKDGRYAYVGIIQAPGGVDVIDTVALKNVKTVPTKGSIHNAYVTPDGKYVVAGSIQGRTINVIDANTNEPAWTLDMDLGVRPMTFNWNPDGSTKWIFVQLTALNGFAVVDAKVNQTNHKPRSAARKSDRARRLGSISRNGRHIRRQDAGRLQQVEQPPLLLLAARPEGARRRRAERKGRRLGDPHAGRKERLRRQPGHQRCIGR